MKNVNINFKKIVDENKNFQKQAERVVRERYLESKKKFISAFELHPVTKELSAGPTATNTSRTLNGIGNLFSFIGFNKTENPINDLRKSINQNFMFRKKRMGNKVQFVINFPALEKLKKDTPLPWESGKSWLTGIERGISGFGNYMYKRFIEGRSGQALQTEKRIRGSSYKPTRYITQLVERFIKDMKT